MSVSKLGRLAMSSIVFATMNCNLALLPYSDCVSDMMQSNTIDVCALQESNVSTANWSSFKNMHEDERLQYLSSEGGAWRHFGHLAVKTAL